MSFRSVCLFVLLAACGGRASGPDVGQDQRFVGRWFVEETQPHALYSASTYALSADGTIEMVWDAGYYGFPQGYVEDPAQGTRCFFGPTWSSRGEHLLVIEGDCEDEVPRDIVLSFGDPSLNAGGAAVAIEEVGGAGGWQPPQWGWSFRKCDETEACTGW